MSSVQWLWMILAASWVTAEIALARWSGRHSGQLDSQDQGSGNALWVVAIASLTVAICFKEAHWLPLEASSHHALALVLFGGGLALRAAAVAHLGHFFTTRVTLHEEHRLVRSGPYRWLRHPSYSGLLLAFMGAGVAMGDWLALLTLAVPNAAAVLLRIGVEERVLAARFPDDFEQYRRRTKKLIPMIY